MFKPFKSGFSDCYCLVGLRKHPLWFFKVTYLRACHSMYILKVGMPDMAFIPRGKASGWEFFLRCGTLHQGGFYGEIVS